MTHVTEADGPRAWLEARWAIVRDTIAAGDVRTVERRYFPLAIIGGVVVGACLGLLSSFLAVVAILGGGFALGYAARAYVSYRRRMDYVRRNRDRF